MSEQPPCPNCAGASIKHIQRTMYACCDKACPVVTFDWNGKYE